MMPGGVMISLLLSMSQITLMSDVQQANNAYKDMLIIFLGVLVSAVLLYTSLLRVDAWNLRETSLLREANSKKQKILLDFPDYFGIHC
jgi:hypothetical protein